MGLQKFLWKPNQDVQKSAGLGQLEAHRPLRAFVVDHVFTAPSPLNCVVQALHIVARKGDERLLRLLLSLGV